jgi:lauroyl/myristoyl acyltransferase
LRVESTDRIKKLPLKKKIIKLIGRLTFMFFFKATGLLKPWSVNFFGSLCGTAFYNVSARYRRIAIKNLTAVYRNEKSEAEIKPIAKQVFVHFARAAFEFFYVISLSREQIDNLVDFEGF